MVTTEECNRLYHELQKLGDGAHAHTMGKAQFYLSRLAKGPTANFKNCTGQQFVDAVNAALCRNEWKALSDLMGRWW